MLLCHPRAADLEWDDATNRAKPTTWLRDALASKPERWGTWLYVHFQHTFLSTWVVPMTPEQIVQSASVCIAFIGWWDALVRRSPGLTIKQHFLTMQTKDDLLIACNQVILAVKLMRLHSMRLEVCPESSPLPLLLLPVTWPWPGLF